jgi:tRNA pseudouridine38-40 synthase
MPSFKITLAYDGTDYVGWQRQANGVSIQSLLEDALRALDGRDVRVTGAGRTDAGVHALGQVAAFTIERTLSADAVLRALNAHLPGAIRVLMADEAAPTFHPRFCACTKTYRYRIWNGDVISPFERRYAWHLTGTLDLDAMRAAARLVEGRHDFAAFQASGGSATTSEREVFASRINPQSAVPIPESPVPPPPLVRDPSSFGGPVRPASAKATAVRRSFSEGGSAEGAKAGSPQSPLLVYEISGSGFLRHMVRTIVGSLVEVGRGRRPAGWIGDLLALRDRTAAGPTAPAMGLFLVSVEYGGALAALS